MKNILVALSTLLAIVSAAPPALAKRAAPPEVAPVERGGIEYAVPTEREGFVVATWKATGREIWSRQIYTIKHEFLRGLEKDVQTCFVTRLAWQGAQLHVNNEQGAEFALDPESLDVTVVKGAAVVDFTGQGPRVGGFSAGAVTNEEVVAAANFAIQAQGEELRKSAPTSTLSLVSIAHVEQQVVAGMNFKMTLNVQHDGKARQAEAVVWWQAWNREAPYKLTKWTWK